jgi:hypothetical protein
MSSSSSRISKLNKRNDYLGFNENVNKVFDSNSNESKDFEFLVEIDEN